MVVHTSLAIGSSHLGEVLGGIAFGIETAVEFALTVGITVVVDILVVECNFHILGEVEIEAGTIEFGRTTIDGLLTTAFVIVHVEELILQCEFDVAPAAASTDAVELGTIGVVALLTAKEKAAAFHIPALEMIRLSDFCFRFHIGPIGHPGTFDTQTIVVAGEFGSGNQVVVGVLDIVGVDILLTADVGGIAAAETRCAVTPNSSEVLGESYMTAPPT